MKSIIPIILLMSLCANVAHAQFFNHVPNPSFEQKINCPANQSGLSSDCVSWRSYNTYTASPDYYHSCNSSLVPSNGGGYQMPLHGNAYAGFIDFNGQNGTRQYLATSITPLVSGKSYEVSMSVSVGNISGHYTQGLAVHFYDSFVNSYYSSTYIGLSPRTNFDHHGQLSDTANWVRLKTYFTADSAYDNIIIGNFYASPSSTPAPGPNTLWGYTYIDSVVVKLVDTFATIYTDNSLCAGDSVDVRYTITDSTGYSSNTTFLLQLSNSVGSFSNPITIGSKTGMNTDVVSGLIPAGTQHGSNYKFRIVSVSPNVTALTTGFIKIGNIDTANVQVSSNSPVCEQQSIILTSNKSVDTGVYYQWTGPGGFTSTDESPTRTAALQSYEGPYYCTTKVYGCTQYDTVDIIVNPNPSIPTASSNTSVCAGDTLELTAIGTNGATYSWTGPNSYNSSDQNPKIINAIVANSGTYGVTANLNGCVRSSSTSVTVLAAPENTVANSNTPLCVGETLNLTATNNTSGVSYSWSGPNSYSSNSQNPSISNTTTTQSGAYIATYSLNGCVEKDTVNVAVNIVPATPAVSYNTPLCVGETLNLSSTSTTSGVSYSWTGPNSFSSNSQNPTKNSVSISDTGTYTLTTTRLNCSSSPASIKVDIRPTPFVVMYTNDDSICKDETVTFNSLANNASGNVQYQWYVNAQAISGATQTTYTTNQLNDADVVYCRMIDNASCSVPFTDESNDIQIAVLPWLAPSVSISVSPQGPIHQDSLITFTATAVDAGVPIYQWKRNGQDVQGATGQTWAARTLNNNDVICVEIESGYKCPMPLTASSNCITAEVVSVNKISNVKSLKLYPNPNAGQFVLEGRISSAAHYDIQIVNALGQVVYTADVATRAGSIYKSMDVNLASGVYLLQLQETETKQTQTVRLIIK